MLNRKYCYNSKVIYFSAFLFLFILILIQPAVPGAAETVRVIVLPFQINAPGDLDYLSGQTAEVLGKHLENSGAEVLALDQQDLKQVKILTADIEQIKAIARKYDAQQIVWGSLTRIGESFSLDARLVSSEAQAEPVSVHAEGRNLENLLNVIKDVADQISMKLFGRELVAQVRIEGNRRIESDAIMRVVKTQPGSIYQPGTVSADLRSIFAMGYFDDLRAEAEQTPQGVIIIYHVEEKPTIRRIQISDNLRFDDEEIKDNLTLSTGAVLNIFKIRSNIDQIESMYKEKNYHQVNVDYEVKRLDNNQADLEFIVEEGPKVYVTSINFEGNKDFEEEDLKDEIKTSEKGFFYWISSSGDLDRTNLDQDIARLNAFYHNKGYINARIAEPQIDILDDGIQITIKIEEGDRYKVGKVQVSGDLVLPEQELVSKLAIAQENFFNREKIRQDIITLTDLYGGLGYAYADVNPRISENPAERVVNIDFTIQKNQQVYMEKIIISGNTRTRDKVIRRELRLQENQLFNAQSLKRSIRNLYRLEYFEDIEVNTIRGSEEDKMTLKINVSEKSTGMFSFGAGYSSEENMFLVGSVSQRNFLGRGQTLQVNGQLGGSTTRFIVSFTEPYVLDTRLSATINGYNQDKEYDEYDLNSKGGGMRFGYPVYDYTRAYLGYRYDVSDISEITNETPDTIRDLEGTNSTSSASLAFIYDSRDRGFNTTEGAKHSISFEYAGIGGDIGFDKYILESGWYIPLFKGFVGLIHAKGGYVTENSSDKILPDYEKFYLGGINSLRGFDFRGVHLTEINELGEVVEIGGNYMVQFNIELIIPIYEKLGLMGVVFYDTGNVYEDGIDLGDMRQSVGGGFRWNSPMAPIRIEYGRVLDPLEGEKSGRWEFTLGGAF